MNALQDDGPIAGPSSRPWVGDSRQDANPWQGARHARDDQSAALRRRRTGRDRRQEAAPSPSPSPQPQPEGSQSPSPTVPFSSEQPVDSSTPFSSADPASSEVSSFDPSALSSPSSSSSTRPPLFSGTRSETFSTASSSTWSDSAPIYTASSLPWSTRSRHSTPSSAPTFVPGVELNMTLGGDSDTEAVYAVPVELGHSLPETKRKRAPGDTNSQLMNVQIDLGSSDMWLASGSCTSEPCSQSKMLFDDSQSLDSGVDVSINYQSGSVDGDIYWEQLTLGSFQIGYQAFISADTVTNQDLENGNFTGVLGLAFSAASQIQQSIPGTTSSNPDGATFLDNLFGSGAYAPTNRMFSMALGRREDVRTGSFLTIGQTSDRLCPPPCSPNYIPVIPQARLGSTGFVHWRIALTGVSATTWSDPENGNGPTVTNVPLGPSFAESTSSSPLAVLDSGGVQILVSRRAYADSLYGAFGVSASSDGLYRMPCKTQMAFTFTFSGSEVPIHPLDMSYPDPTDPSQATCIGMIQYADNLGADVGDFILGSSFLKNVYSIYQYPDQVRATRWQPTIGLIPLTNASVASRDFYAVRSNRQSLRSVSSDEASDGGQGPWNPTASSPASNDGGTGGKKMASTAVIVGCSIVGFFVLAAAAFAAWWFWLRRRHGSAGVVDYNRKSGSGDSSRGSVHSGSTSRAKKHENSQRQKSMIEGYSDFEGDSSWVSETGDSIRLGYIPEVAEDGEEESKARPAADLEPSPSRTRILNNAQLLDEPIAMPIAGGTRDCELSPAGRRGSSPSARLSLAHQSRPSHSQSGPYPSIPKSATARSLSVSMNGPFPSTQGPGPANRRPDVSPMYDINTSDYFEVPGRGRTSQGASGSRERDRTPSGARPLNAANPFDTP